MIVKSYKCDICGTPKKETNHWLIAFLGSGQIRILKEWSNAQANSKHAKHICGQNCVHKLVDSFVSLPVTSAVVPTIHAVSVTSSTDYLS